jgi:hypothetical protein
MFVDSSGCNGGVQAGFPFLRFQHEPHSLRHVLARTRQYPGNSIVTTSLTFHIQGPSILRRLSAIAASLCSFVHLLFL